MTTVSIQVPRIRFVSVICWDGAFRENFDAVRCTLNQTLPKDRYELVFVEYFEQVNPQVLAIVEGRANARALALGNPHPGAENQHLIGACINEGLRRSRGDLIVVPDADVIFEEDFLEEVVRQHERVEALALYFYRMDEPETERPVPRTIEHLKEVGELKFPENYGGCLTVRKRWLEAVNGYDEDPIFRGYSSVGEDLARRLKALGLCIKWHPSKLLYHGYHPGCHRPDEGSLRRVQVQRLVYEGRAKALETLPEKGLTPGPRPKWRYDLRALGLRRRPLKAAIRKVVHLVIPRYVRQGLIRLLRD